MDLDSFAKREFGAGEMAVVFYRKHPGQDDQLQVRWLADLVEPASALLAQPDFLRQLEAFDRETDTLLRALAGSLEGLMRHRATTRVLGVRPVRSTVFVPACTTSFASSSTSSEPAASFRNGIAMVDDPAKVRAAQTLASVIRKIEFLNANAEYLGPCAPWPDR